MKRKTQLYLVGGAVLAAGVIGIAGGGDDEEPAPEPVAATAEAEPTTEPEPTTEEPAPEPEPEPSLTTEEAHERIAGAFGLTDPADLPCDYADYGWGCAYQDSHVEDGSKVHVTMAVPGGIEADTVVRPFVMLVPSMFADSDAEDVYIYVNGDFEERVSLD